METFQSIGILLLCVVIFSLIFTQQYLETEIKKLKQKIKNMEKE